MGGGSPQIPKDYWHRVQFEVTVPTGFDMPTNLNPTPAALAQRSLAGTLPWARGPQSLAGSRLPR